MLGIGGATGYSISTSQGNQNKGDRFFSHTIILGSVFSALYMVIGFLFSDQISFVLGAEGDTFEMCRTYLRVLLLFSPFFIFNNIFISFVRNDGYPQRAMTAMLCGDRLFSCHKSDYHVSFSLKEENKVSFCKSKDVNKDVFKYFWFGHSLSYYGAFIRDSHNDFQYNYIRY